MEYKKQLYIKITISKLVFHASGVTTLVGLLAAALHWI